MTDREKVIKGLECCGKGNMCRNHCPYDGPENDIKNCTSQLARDALSLLKAQEPIPPIRTDEEWLCGNCKEVVGWDELQVYGIEEIKEPYCHNCGRKVKWND